MGFFLPFDGFLLCLGESLLIDSSTEFNVLVSFYARARGEIFFFFDFLTGREVDEANCESRSPRTVGERLMLLILRVGLFPVSIFERTWLRSIF